MHTINEKPLDLGEFTNERAEIRTPNQWLKRHNQGMKFVKNLAYQGISWVIMLIFMSIVSINYMVSMLTAPKLHPISSQGR